MSGQCVIDASRRDELREKYTALHEGLPPRQMTCERWDPPSGVVHPIHDGCEERGVAIQYKKRIPDGKPSFRHPWASQAQPRMGVDDDGKLWFWSGRHETSRRGIEDRVTPGMKPSEYLVHPYVREERLPKTPTELTTLGKLQWVRYKVITPAGSVSEKRLVWPEHIAPDVAHDQNGDLHILGGRYEITERGVEEIMANARSSRRSRKSRARRSRSSRSRHNPSLVLANPSRSSRRRRRSGSRSLSIRSSSRMNPSRSVSIRASSSSAGSRAARMVMASLVTSSVAVVSAVGIDMALNRLAPAMAPQYRALSKIGISLAAGVGLGLAMRDERFAAVPVGVSVGGTIDGLRDLYNLYVAPRISAALTPAPAATTPAPGGRAYLPGGVPAGYAAYNPQSCGVAVNY